MPEPDSEFTAEQVARSMQADAEWIVILRQCLNARCEECQHRQHCQPARKA